MHLAKPHMHPFLSLRSFPSVALWNTSNVRLTDNVPLSFFSNKITECFLFPCPLSSRWLTVWWSWICACRQCLELLNISGLPRCKPLVRESLLRWVFSFCRLPTASSCCCSCKFLSSALRIMTNSVQITLIFTPEVCNRLTIVSLFQDSLLHLPGNKVDC